MKLLILLFVAVVFSEVIVEEEQCNEWTQIRLDCPYCVDKIVQHEVICEEWQLEDDVCVGLNEGLDYYHCSSKGDPHFSIDVDQKITFDNPWRGDVFLVMDAAKPMFIQARQEPFGNINSINTKLAIRGGKNFENILIYEIGVGLSLKDGFIDPSATPQDLNNLVPGVPFQIGNNGDQVVLLAVTGTKNVLKHYRYTGTNGYKVDFSIIAASTDDEFLSYNEGPENNEELFINIVIWVPSTSVNDVYGLCSLAHIREPLFAEAQGMFTDVYDIPEVPQEDLMPQTTMVLSQTEIDRATDACRNSGIAENLLPDCVYDFLATEKQNGNTNVVLGAYSDFMTEYGSLFY